MSDKRILIIGNLGRDQVRRTIDEVRPAIEPHAVVDEQDLECDPNIEHSRYDLAVVVGGDGSILRAARCAAPVGLPCMGLNIGRLGFLASFRADEMAEALPEALEGRQVRVERMMLDIQIDKHNGRDVRETCLNDVVVAHGSSHRMIEVEVAEDHQPVASYRGDGVIVSTPTGSTAYNLAAGGPILDAALDVMVLTPICPHMLTHRSIVLEASRTLRLRPSSSGHESDCIIDGQMRVALADGDQVRIERAEHRFILVENRRRTDFDTLREKLHWSHPPGYGA